MAFKYDPTAEVTERKFKPLPAGEYDFEITGAVAKVSKKAQAEGITEPNMIELNMKVFTDDSFRYVYDYLMPSVAYKFKHFCEAVGFDDPTNEWGPEECIGKVGRLKLTIQKGTPQYPDDKNSVQDYIPGAPVVKHVDLDDSIPF